MPILDLEAPADLDELTIRDHLDISNATENVLDVTRWSLESAAPMATDEVNARMAICEWFIGEEIIDPILNGEV